MTDFDPYQVARGVLATTDLCDPADIAEAIFKQTPKDKIAGAYKVMLRAVARDTIRSVRVDGEFFKEQAGPSRSSKVAGIRAHHFDFFGQRVFANNEWKLLGDCTRADVRDLAARRREVAAFNSAKADEFDELDARMAAAGVDVVRDLKRVAA